MYRELIVLGCSVLGFWVTMGYGVGLGVRGVGFEVSGLGLRACWCRCRV